jgi:hypothetical protein
MFSLLKREFPDGKKPIFLLVEDGICPIWEFEEEIQKEGNYEIQIDKIRTSMYGRSCGARLSEDKFKDLKPRPNGDNVKDYEYKTHMLRVYSFEYEGGEVIWGGEKKDPNKQSRTIARMRRAKASFYAQVNSPVGIKIKGENENV